MLQTNNKSLCIFIMMAPSKRTNLKYRDKHSANLTPVRRWILWYKDERHRWESCEVWYTPKISEIRSWEGKRTHKGELSIYLDQRLIKYFFFFFLFHGCGWGEIVVKVEHIQNARKIKTRIRKKMRTRLPFQLFSLPSVFDFHLLSFSCSGLLFQISEAKFFRRVHKFINSTR